MSANKGPLVSLFWTNGNLYEQDITCFMVLLIVIIFLNYNIVLVMLKQRLNQLVVQKRQYSPKGWYQV